MALIKCPECKKKISDQCERCPNCGYPIEVKKEPKENKTIVEEAKESNKEKKPINKKMLIGIISAIVVLLVVCGIIIYNALLPRINATKDFKTAVVSVQQKNTELESAIIKSEELIAKKQPLLNENLLSELENTISDTKAVKVTDFEKPKEVETIITRTKELNKIDYSDALTKLSNKHKEYEINAKRYQLVNVPTEAYVIQCLKTIPEITGISAVTEDNDPNGNLNKLGGYTATVYFSHEKLKLNKSIYGDTIIEQGTDGGGAIEVYTCVEDAIKRRDYLANFDGTITASGTHTVIGTVLVRTSNELTASQQKDLEAKLIEALTYLPEVDGEKENPKEQEIETTETTTSVPVISTQPSTNSTPKKSDDKERALQVAIDLCDEVDDGDATVRRTWLKGWLIETEGFSESAAAYAVNNIDYDWYASALFYANNYEYWGEDVEDIPNLLSNDGYTADEVNYACENANWNND